MNSKLLFNKALTLCLTFALIATYSMVALASDGRATGEIVVKGSNEASVATVNGEGVESGRTIFSSSTISTPEGVRAIVNLGKAGRLEIAPNTTFFLSFDQTEINGDLTSGSVTVLNAAKSVSVKIASGEVIKVNTGETASAASGTAQKQAAAAATPMWWLFAVVLGGAVAGVVVATSQNNENRFGGSNVSPTS